MLITSMNSIISDIDWADGFPRYYFHSYCLAKELRAWLDAQDKHMSEKNDR